MAKKQTEEKVSRNPKDWEGYEKEHSLQLGQIVRMRMFGRLMSGLEVIELMTDPTHGLPCYRLLAPDGTKYPYIGTWYSKAMFAQIIL